MKEAPVARMGELYGKLYYYLAKELVDSFGNDGEQALRRAVRSFAVDRGEQMRAQAEEMGLPLDWHTFSRGGIGDMPDTQPGYKKYHPNAKGTIRKKEVEIRTYYAIFKTENSRSRF